MIIHGAQRLWTGGAPPVGPDPDFVAEIETTTPDEVFTWGLSPGTNNAVIDYGDGSPTQTITSTTDPNRIHTYVNPGIYVVRISGPFSGPLLFNTAEADKVNKIISFGTECNGTLRDTLRGSSSLTRIEAGDFGNVSYLTSSMQDCNALAYFKNEISVATASNNVFRDCSGLVECYADFSQSGGMEYAFYRCSSLTTLQLAQFQKGPSFRYGFRECTSLVNFPPNVFDQCLSTNYVYAFVECALSQQSVDNIIVSVDVSGVTDGTLHLYGGTNAAPGAAGQAAKTSLEGKGWTVLTN